MQNGKKNNCINKNIQRGLNIPVSYKKFDHPQFPNLAQKITSLQFFQHF